MKYWGCALAVALLAASSVATPELLGDKVWVIVRPVQCLGNPWEKDWLARHHHREDQYPRQQEGVLIKNYFAKKKIPILDIRMKPYDGKGLCAACDCSRGDILYFLMDAKYARKMVRMGYTERLPANEIPLKN